MLPSREQSGSSLSRRTIKHPPFTQTDLNPLFKAAWIPPLCLLLPFSASIPNTQSAPFQATLQRISKWQLCSHSSTQYQPLVVCLTQLLYFLLSILKSYTNQSLADAFNIDYYLNKHIPLARDAWSKYGLTKWSVVELAPETGYSVQTVMIWESPQSLGKAMKEAGAEVMADLKNFSTEKPVVIQGAIAAGTLE